jgi:hypothetical protein
LNLLKIPFEISITSKFSSGNDLLLGKVLRLISRDEWLAEPAREELTPLNLPIKRVIVTHTATDICETQV